MRIIGKTDIGRNRAENQDNFRSGNRVGTAAWGIVCDGMGGAENGKLASSVAVDAIEDQFYRNLKKKLPMEEVRQVMLNSIQQANREVYIRSGEGRHVMGTTVVAAVLKQKILHIAHVGDSRAYLFENNSLRQLTRDHSIVQELVDQGALSQEAASHHPEKNVITRALGVEDSVEISYGEIPVNPGSIILLCSDGLSNMVNGEKMADMIASIDFYDLPSEFVNEALKAGGNDNITVLLLQVQEGDC